MSFVCCAKKGYDIFMCESVKIAFSRSLSVLYWLLEKILSTVFEYLFSTFECCTRFTILDTELRDVKRKNALHYATLFSCAPYLCCVATFCFMICCLLGFPQNCMCLCPCQNALMSLPNIHILPINCQF